MSLFNVPQAFRLGAEFYLLPTLLSGSMLPKRGPNMIKQQSLMLMQGFLCPR